MIDGLILRWVVTALFVISAAECARAIAKKPRPWTLSVSHGWHLLMAVGMAVMAWPWGVRLPATGPAVFFLLGAVWFVAVAVAAGPIRDRLALDGYHALMMLATAWMYAIMDPHLLGTQPATPMPGMEMMPGMDMDAAHMSGSNGHPVWFSATNWVGVVGFAAAALWWTYRYFHRRQHEPVGCSLSQLVQAMLAAGMSILFLAALFPI